jgi:hypothetical protein
MTNRKCKNKSCRVSGIWSRTVYYPNVLEKKYQNYQFLEHNRSRIKRLPNSERRDVDETLLKWFKQYRSETVPVTCFNYQLNAQFLYSIIMYYIIVLDMFQAILCSSSGDQSALLQHLVSSFSVSGRTMHRCTVRPLTESDDTRCCNNKIWPPEDENSIARNMSRIIM